MKVPSGYVKIAIENGHRNSGDFPITNGGSLTIVMLNYQRVLFSGNMKEICHGNKMGLPRIKRFTSWLRTTLIVR